MSLLINEEIKQPILVDVFVIAYNHGNFIKECIESIANQITKFQYRIVIGEDCSKDNTRQICEQCIEVYGTKIHLLPSDKNFGMMGNTIRTLNACTAKYIAFCEGDDYWIDPYKLQKQFDLLERNIECTLCFTKMRWVDKNNQEINNPITIPIKKEYNLSDILNFGPTYIQTASLFIRNILPKPLPSFLLNALGGDIPIQLIALNGGYGLYIEDETAAYRIHPGGITNTQKHKEEGDIRVYKMFEEAFLYCNKKHNQIYKNALHVMTKTMLLFGSRNLKGEARKKHLAYYFPKYFKYQSKFNLKEFILIIYSLYIKNRA